VCVPSALREDPGGHAADDREDLLEAGERFVGIRLVSCEPRARGSETSRKAAIIPELTAARRNPDTRVGKFVAVTATRGGLLHPLPDREPVRSLRRSATTARTIRCSPVRRQPVGNRAPLRLLRNTEPSGAAGRARWRRRHACSSAAAAATLPSKSHADPCETVGLRCTQRTQSVSGDSRPHRRGGSGSGRAGSAAGAGCSRRTPHRESGSRATGPSCRRAP
jgi:hypothetical protein